MRSTFLYFSFLFFLLFFNNIKTKEKRKQKRQREKGGRKKKNNVRRHKEVKIRKRMCSSSASYRRTYKTYMENTNGSPNTFSFKQKE